MIADAGSLIAPIRMDPTDPDQHPIFSHMYAVDTPAIQQFGATVCDWIEDRASGGYIHGPSRFGKSRAVKFWIRDIVEERRNGRVAFFRAICPSRSRPLERDFLAAIANGVCMTFDKGNSIYCMCLRVAKMFCSVAASRGTNQIVFLIDEAQRMTSVEYGVLCNVQNIVENMGFQVTIISVGSHELTYQHEAMLLGGDAHLVGRFMVHSAPFRGICGPQELSYVLAGYDEATEWPPGSGASFTNYFLPQAFGNGFRLQDYAEVMWSCFEAMAPVSLRKQLQVPMEHIGRSIERIYKKYTVDDRGQFSLPDGALRTAIEATEYAAHMRAIAIISGYGRR